MRKGSRHPLGAVLRPVAALAGVLSLLGSGVIISLGHLEPWWTGYTAFIALFALFFSAFTWYVLPHQPRNPVLWTMAISGVGGGVYVAGFAVALLLLRHDPGPLIGSVVVPAELPTGAAWALALAVPAGIAGLNAWLTFGLLLFPDGATASPRWRAVAWLSALAIALTTIALAREYRPGNTMPADQGGGLLDAIYMTLILAIALSLSGLLTRFSRSRGEVREQFKWIAWGACIFVPLIILVILFEGTRWEDLLLLPLMLGEAVFLASYDIAVGKHHLYDIDLVISRTLVYGIVGLLGVLYAGAVFVLRGVFPWEGDLAVAASTLLVAALFNPLRRRVQRIVDLRFYRSRCDTRQVALRFSERLQHQVDLEMLRGERVEVVGETLKPERADVWLRPARREESRRRRPA